MSDTPNLGELLAPFVRAIPEPARPAFLAGLERTAADRYRLWAELLPDHAPGLLGCAAREDEIADRVERVLGADAEAREKIDSVLPGARDSYYEVFSSHSLRSQLRMQADAERLGANAWRMLASQQSHPAVRHVLESCSDLEEQSAAHLEALLDRATLG